MVLVTSDKEIVIVSVIQMSSYRSNHQNPKELAPPQYIQWVRKVFVILN